MSEREKLIELMTTQFRELINDGDWTLGEMIPNIADNLLKNNVDKAVERIKALKGGAGGWLN